MAGRGSGNPNRVTGINYLNNGVAGMVEVPQLVVEALYNAWMNWLMQDGLDLAPFEAVGQQFAFGGRAAGGGRGVSGRGGNLVNVGGGRAVYVGRGRADFPVGAAGGRAAVPVGGCAGRGHCIQEDRGPLSSAPYAWCLLTMQRAP